MVWDPWEIEPTVTKCTLMYPTDTFTNLEFQNPFLNFLKLANLRILRVRNCERAGRVCTAGMMESIIDVHSAVEMTISQNTRPTLLHFLILKSVVQRFWTTQNLSIFWSWGFEILKGSVGYVCLVVRIVYHVSRKILKSFPAKTGPGHLLQLRNNRM